MSRAELLAEIPLFRSLEPSDLAVLAGRLEEVSARAGEVIFREGDSGTARIFLIEEGTVEIVHGEGPARAVLATLGARQFFGELALLDGGARSATAIAHTPARLLSLDRESLIDFLIRDPEIALAIVSELGARLRRTNELVSKTTEDFHRLGGMEALEAPYLRVGFWQMIKKRAGWLAVLFVGEMLTATAMGHYEEEIARAVVLALFVPLIISSGGNSGSQATSLIIRGLALGEVKLTSWFKVLTREIASGLSLGVLLGGIGLLRIVVWQQLGWTDYGPHYLAIGFTVWASLVGVVTFGTTAGSMLPFIMRALGFDPATSSAPFVATLVDVTGLIIYFSVAALLLRGLLL